MQFIMFFLNYFYFFKLHKSIETLDKKNDCLRESIKELYALIAEYQEIKVKRRYFL